MSRRKEKLPARKPPPSSSSSSSDDGSPPPHPASKKHQAASSSKDDGFPPTRPASKKQQAASSSKDDGSPPTRPASKKEKLTSTKPLPSSSGYGSPPHPASKKQKAASSSVPPKPPPQSKASSSSDEDGEEVDSSESESEHGSPPPRPASKKQQAASSSVPPKSPPPKKIQASSSSDEDGEEAESSESESEPESPSPHKKPPHSASLPPVASTTPPVPKPLEDSSSSDDDSDNEEEEEEPPKASLPKAANGSTPEKPNKSPPRKRKVSDVLVLPENKEELNASKKLWSDTDQLVLLKGMIEFQARNGNEPKNATDAAKLLEITGNKLLGEFSLLQIVTKMRGMKKKYNSNMAREREGMEITFVKPLEQELFDLSKKLWGHAVVENGDEDGKRSTAPKRSKTGTVTSSRKKTKKMNTDLKENIVGSMIPVFANDICKEGSTGDNVEGKVPPSNPVTRFIIGEAEKDGLSPQQLDTLKRALANMNPVKIAGFGQRGRQLELDELQLLSSRKQLLVDVLISAEETLSNGNQGN